MKKFNVTIKQVHEFKKTFYANTQEEAIARTKEQMASGRLEAVKVIDVRQYAEEVAPRYVVRTSRLGLIGVALEGDTEIIARFDHEEDAQAFAKLKNEMEGLK